jgi:hypothetical protein
LFNELAVDALSINNVIVHQGDALGRIHWEFTINAPDSNDIVLHEVSFAEGTKCQKSGIKNHSCCMASVYPELPVSTENAPCLGFI